MERDARQARPRDVEQALVEVDALALEAALEALEVFAGPAGDVQQRPRLRRRARTISSIRAHSAS